MKRIIRRFRLEYDYLSNFYPACVQVDGLEYLSSEAAFQAALEFIDHGGQQEKAKSPRIMDWEQDENILFKIGASVRNRYRI